MRGMFSTYDEPLSPNEGAACLRYNMMNRCRQMMVNRNRQMRGCVSDIGNRIAMRGAFFMCMRSWNRQKRVACVQYMVNRNRQMRRRV